MQLLFRNARTADVEDIMQIHRACLSTLVTHYSTERVQQYINILSFEYYAPLLKNGHFIVAVKEEENRAIAFSHMEKCNTHNFSTPVDFEIHKFYVSPEESRKGVGRSLCEELERRALEEGACGIGVKSSLNAVPFYETCGFRQTGVEDPSDVGGVMMGCKHMVKSFKQ